MAEEILSQQSRVYILLANAAVEIPNVVDVGEFGPMSDDIDATNLRSTAKEFRTGIPDNGEATLQINHKSTDDTHIFLAAQAGNGVLHKFMVCLSESDTDPTVASGELVAPVDCTSYGFEATVKSYRGALKVNDLVRKNCTLRISGAVATTNPAT
jgi:hypothetical protein